MKYPEFSIKEQLICFEKKINRNMNKIGPGIAEYPLDSNGNYDSYWPSCSNAPLDEILVLGDIRPFPKKEAIGLDVVYIWRP